MMAINDFIINEKGEVVTCSDDFTLRVWQDEEHFAIKKILAGHKSGVVCLELYANCVISGSKAGEVAVWKDYKLFFMLQGLPPVEELLVCP
jgi:WD40 repeat protein